MNRSTALHQPEIMQQENSRRNNHRPVRQQDPRMTQDSYTREISALRQEVAYLKSELETERGLDQENRYVSLSRELRETKEKLEKQKFLKEMYINREKETKRKLERLEKYCDGNALAEAKIATQVRNNTKQKKKKDLHKDYEELKVAHIINQERFGAELQVQTDMNVQLQEELDKNGLSYNDISEKYETDVVAVRQQAETLQHELERETRKREFFQKQFEELHAMLNLQTLASDLMAERAKNKQLQEELEQMKLSYQEVTQRHETVVSVTQQVKKLQQDLEQEVERHACTVLEHQRFVQDLKAEHEVMQQQLQTQLEVQVAQNAELKALTETSSPQEPTIELEEEVKVEEGESMSEAPSAEPTIELQEEVEVEEGESTSDAPSTEPTIELQEVKVEEAESTSDAPSTEPTVELQEEPEVPMEGPCKEDKSEFDGLSTEPTTQLQEKADVSEEKPCEKQESVPKGPSTVSSMGSTEEAGVTEQNLPVTKKKKSSVWKRTRHALGLRKPQRWKKKKEEAE